MRGCRECGERGDRLGADLVFNGPEVPGKGSGWHPSEVGDAPLLRQHLDPHAVHARDDPAPLTLAGGEGERVGAWGKNHVRVRLSVEMRQEPINDRHGASFDLTGLQKKCVIDAAVWETFIPHKTL